jgi:alkylation response protein AidB-like acyl-CoA dehydrogenase
MDFGLSEEQRALQDTLKRFLDSACDLEEVRAAAGDTTRQSADVWQGLVDMGLTSLLVPEAYGGLGLSLLDAALVQEALGEHTAPVAYVPTAIIAPLALCLAGNSAQKEKWLPAIAAGEIQVAVGLTEGGGSRDGAGLSVSDGRLSGRVLFVEGAAEAQWVLCSSTDGDLYLIQRDEPGLDWQALRSIDDTRCLWELNFEGVAAELLPEGEGDVVAPLLAAARIALAADTLGAAQCMIEKAVEYAQERKQFKRVIGSFQAVKHMCAEMAAELEPCRSLLWYAAHAFDTAPDERVLMACHTKAHLSEVGTFVARTATEVHGGMGFTDLLGLHYWFKRIGFNRQVMGSPERLREQAARVQGLV